MDAVRGCLQCLNNFFSVNVEGSILSSTFPIPAPDEQQKVLDEYIAREEDVAEAVGTINFRTLVVATAVAVPIDPSRLAINVVDMI